MAKELGGWGTWEMQSGRDKVGPPPAWQAGPPFPTQGTCPQEPKDASRRWFVLGFDLWGWAGRMLARILSLAAWALGHFPGIWLPPRETAAP